LLEDYYENNLLLSWYLSTPKNNYFEIYIEIITYILQKKYKKVLFTGGSGAGYPAIIFSSYFKKNCLIFNPQIYLDKYFYFENMLEILKIQKEDIEYNIETFINKHGSPNNILLIVNIRDEIHYKEHALYFENYMKNNNNNIMTLYFKGPNPPKKKDFHHDQIPENTTYHKLIFKALFQ
jgi:hypothetical protein